jgi:hypothetical protein
METYIVFQDTMKGMTMIPQMSADTFEEAVQNITEGCVGCRIPSQNCSYFIYKLHQSKVPFLSTKAEYYRYVKRVDGSKVDTAYNNHKRMLEYAITLQCDSTDVWYFTDERLVEETHMCKSCNEIMNHTNFLEGKMCCDIPLFGDDYVEEE